MKDYVSINERIKDLRSEAHLNQAELGNAVNIPKTTISDYEQDGYPVPHTAVIALSQYFGVSSDFLLGITANRNATANSPDNNVFDDSAIEAAADMNQRLLSELIADESFKQFMLDMEIYVDGFVDESLQNLNYLVKFARNKMKEKSDIYSETLEKIDVSQDEYFAHLLVDDILPVLQHIKEAHKKDKETSDNSYSQSELEKIAEAVQTNSDTPLKGLASAIMTALKIKTSPQNIDSAEKMIETPDSAEKTMTDLLRQSEIVEPNARKRKK